MNDPSVTTAYRCRGGRGWPRGPVCRRRAALRQLTHWRPHRPAGGRSGAAGRRVGSGCGRQDEGLRRRQARRQRRRALDPIEPNSANVDVGWQMQVKDLLRMLDFGSSVAEHDDLLERYFVETETFRALIQDRVDIIAGDKGTGKSAIYRILSKQFAEREELSNVELVSAFNVKGTPVFQRLADADTLDEQDYVNIWKAYFFSLAGNWLLQLYDGDYTDDMQAVDKILSESGFRTVDDNPGGVFGRIFAGIKKVLRPKTAEGSVKVAGIAELTGKLEFFAKVHDVDDLTRYDDALRLLDRVLLQSDIKIWLALDRLDEAFQGRPQLETPALRALFRCYLDMQEFDNIKLKIFVRRDLFARIIKGGFVNLTHINARKIEIRWDESDLYSLLHRRVIENEKLVRKLDVDASSADECFAALFPEKVDASSKRPVTWRWMMSRIGDANVKPPRNLIDLVIKSREAQNRREDRDPRKFESGTPLIMSDSIKRGLEALSSERVQDTLIAESGDYSGIIELFRDGKAEHNDATLSALLGEDYRIKVEYLIGIGFLERVGSNYKIPQLYRSGLRVRQGKAFSVNDGQDEEDDED